MTVEEFKKMIEQRSGVPAALLDGDKPEEILERARSLADFRSRNEIRRPKSSAEQFAAWFHEQTGEGASTDEQRQALDEIEEMVRRLRGGYPVIHDGGELDHSGLPDGRQTRDQFAEWLNERTQFDPFIDPDGWKRIC